MHQTQVAARCGPVRFGLVGQQGDGSRQRRMTGGEGKGGLDQARIHRAFGQDQHRVPRQVGPVAAHGLQHVQEGGLGPRGLGPAGDAERIGELETAPPRSAHGMQNLQKSHRDLRPPRLAPAFPRDPECSLPGVRFGMGEGGQEVAQHGQQAGLEIIKAQRLDRHGIGGRQVVMHQRHPPGVGKASPAPARSTGRESRSCRGRQAARAVPSAGDGPIRPARQRARAGESGPFRAPHRRSGVMGDPFRRESIWRKA